MPGRPSRLNSKGPRTVIVCLGLQPEACYKKSNNLLIGCPGNACRRRSTSAMPVHSRHGLQTWHQGALFTKLSDGVDGQHLMCPHCAQPATPVHLLRMCKETKRQFPTLSAEDQFELEHGLNLEFWTQGLLMAPALNLATGGASVQAWGTWTTQDEARIEHPHMVTIGIASTSADSRRA